MANLAFQTARQYATTNPNADEQVWNGIKYYAAFQAAVPIFSPLVLVWTLPAIIIIMLIAMYFIGISWEWGLLLGYAVMIVPNYFIIRWIDWSVYLASKTALMVI